MQEVARWRIFEWRLKAGREYANPMTELEVTAEFAGPDGGTRSVNGFWDGGAEWKVRFRPDVAGRWRAVSHCVSDAGLDGQTAGFECVAQETENALYRHGPVEAQRGERILRHRDGTPFFWLGDTAWNGVLKSQKSDWRDYLADRAAKRFNVVQFVTTQWLAAAGNADARLAYIGHSPIAIDPEFFRWMDERIDAMNDAGFMGAGVIAWAATWNRQALGLSPGTGLPEEDIVRLGRYLLARYGAHHMAWLLAGDGHYESEEAARWRRIGRAVFEGSDALATIHPGGHLWLEDEFRDEPWFRFHGYQSGHWRGEEPLDWIRKGPALKAWARTPAFPQINLEFCYEAHEDFDTHRAFDAFDVRRDAYSSLLATVPAGITYGAHGVWSWESEPRLPMSHPKTGLARPWREAIAFEGSSSMRRLREIFESINWWRLEPAPQLLRDPASGSAAMSRCGDLAMIYTPSAEAPAIRTELLAPGFSRNKIDPATGVEPGPDTRDLLILFKP